MEIARQGMGGQEWRWWPVGRAEKAEKAMGGRENSLKRVGGDG